MRLFLTVFAFTLASCVWSQDYGYLKESDQNYFKNDVMDGKNKLERIDANVREINILHGKVSELKMEIQKLKAEVEELKKKK